MPYRKLKTLLLALKQIMVEHPGAYNKDILLNPTQRFAKQVFIQSMGSSFE